MPQRKPHKKSRNGCESCKQRRTKCDEQGPPCANCVIRQTECVYPKTSRPRQAETPSDTSQSQSQDHPSPVSDRELHKPTNRMLELELLHHYTSSTYRSLASYAHDTHRWQVIIPQEALKHEFLLHSIFAFTSLHLAVTGPKERSPAYLNTAMHYHNLAFNTYVVELGRLSEGNHLASFAAAILLITLGHAMAYYGPPTEPKSSPIENAIVQFELIQGCTSVASVSKGWLENGPMQSFLEFQSGPKHLDPETETALDRLDVILENKYFQARERGPNAEALTLYERRKKTVSMLRLCFGMHDDNENRATAMVFQALVERDFIVAVKAHEPFALFVLLHWAVLLQKVDEKMWWTGKTGYETVACVSEVIRPEGPCWDVGIRWARRVAGLPER